MISCALTSEYGVLASDSARYDKGHMSYDLQKMLYFGRKYLITYIGVSLYLKDMNEEWFKERMDRTVMFLSDHFKMMETEVAKKMPELVAPGDSLHPTICMYVLGIKDEKVTLAEINSHADYRPRYLQATKKPVYAGIYYGDDSQPKKKTVFKQAKQYMEKLSKKRKELSPGLMGEILTRGIYHKADLEEKAFKQKYAGGVVSVGMLHKDGKAYGLSNIRL